MRMKQEELNKILELHTLWLRGSTEGKRASLRGANLSFTNLRGADLDYSCWPICCSSLGVKADEQLFYRVLALAKTSEVDVGVCDKIKELANKSKPVIKYGKEKI